MYRLLIFLVTLSVHALRAIFRTRGELLIENLALRQQVATLKKERPRPVLDDVDRAFWVALRDPIGDRKSGHRCQAESRPTPALLGKYLPGETGSWAVASRR